MIDNVKLDEARTILDEVVKGITVIVVPQSLSVGTAENPAICLKDAIQVKWVKQQMGQPEIRKYVKDDVAWDALIDSVAVNTLVIQEAVFDGTRAYKSAVIWHEHGHVLHGKSENGKVYLYEVTNLTNHKDALGEKAVRDVLTNRTSAYRGAVDPGVEALRTYLKDNWQITL